jgi:hypothetical protein
MRVCTWNLMRGSRFIRLIKDFSGPTFFTEQNSYFMIIKRDYLFRCPIIQEEPVIIYK